MSAPSAHNSLWLMRPTLQHAGILPCQFKCQASDSVASGSHTESTFLNQQNHPGSHTHGIKTPAGLMWHLAGSSSLLLLWNVRGWLGHPERGVELRCLTPRCLAPPRPDRERESRPGAGALAVRKICGVAPPFHWPGISHGVWRLWG